MIDYGAAAPMLDDEHVISVLLIDVETLVNVLRYNTSGWDLEWGGETWYAGGGVLDVLLPDEDSNLEAHKCVIKVASLNPAQTSLALSQNLHSRFVGVHHAILDPTTYNIVAVARLFSGRVSNLVLNKAAIDGE